MFQGYGLKMKFLCIIQIITGKSIQEINALSKTNKMAL